MNTLHSLYEPGRPPRHPDAPGTVPQELAVARGVAAAQLGPARAWLDAGDPARAIAALRSAWHAVEAVPGGEAFQDLVAIDETLQALRRRDRRLAAAALSALAARLGGRGRTHERQAFFV